jgi:iron complex transport system permease protein
MLRKLNNRTIFLILVSLFFCTVFVSLSYGQIHIPVQAVLAIVAEQLHIPGLENISITQEQTAVIWHLRMPRTLVGILVGAALAVTGAVMQGVFGNPLADPGIIGVSSGAALGAVLAIATGLSTVSMFYMPLFALIGALLTVAFTVFLAMHDNKISVMTLLLAGVAVSIFLGALTSGILTFISEYKLREFLFWTVGGLDYRRWEHVLLGFIPILAGVTILCALARQLNILVLGEEEARAVGMSVAKLRLLLLFVATLTTATAVCISGSIGFVGLVVPHIMRLILGPEHRSLLPACALAGGIFLVGCDTVGRFIIPPAEVRVGIMTALIGAPYFLYLLRRAQKGGLF